MGIKTQKENMRQIGRVGFCNFLKNSQGNSRSDLIKRAFIAQCTRIEIGL